MRRRWLTWFIGAGLTLLPSGAVAQKDGAPLPKNSYWISSPFGWRVHPISGVWRMHLGVDLACPVGTRVRAVREGFVIVAGRHSCFGLVVVLLHPGNIVTLYAHLSRIADGMFPGSVVRRGQVIALSGATGCVTGPHLHFEWLEGGKPVDPVPLLAESR